MTTTARFDIQRRKDLRALFDLVPMTRLWRRLVRDQMRAFDIKDIHDYYDFNYSVESRVKLIIDRILSGQYTAEPPLIYRAEKKLGICRHLMIPSPSDALVFQTLTDNLYGSILAAQPSKKAYYSRDRHHLSLPHEHKEAISYPWFILWPRFQQDIWKFSNSHNYVVTTDLLNYFDNIGLRELRHVISSIATSKEVYLDLLFSLIEDLSWKPDYLPTSHQGLPTINIEAPRLLSHALLFEVDEILKQRTDDSFVRWMDDINFGIDDLKSANLILGELNDVLKSRGLALNLAKTSVLSPKQAEKHFLFRENLRLTKLQKYAKTLRNSLPKRKLARRLAKELETHLAQCQARNKDKVTKRYFGVLGTLGVPVALKNLVEVFASQPGMRASVLMYLSRLPFAALTATTFVRLLRTDVFDDITRFQLVDAIVRWYVPLNESGKAFVSQVKAILTERHSEFDWFCWMYFLAKYGEPHLVLTAAVTARGYHPKEPFFARQCMAILPRALGINENQVKRLWTNEISSGTGDSASVAANLLHFLKSGFPPQNDRAHFYLFPNRPQRPYPLSKFLLLCVIARADQKLGRTVRRVEVLEHVNDPWFRHWLKGLQPYWF